MIDVVNWVVGSAFLVLLSVIDFRSFDKEKGYVPSVLTTLFLVFGYITNFPESIFSGVMVGLIALLLTELEFWGGIADFKTFVGAGMLFSNFVEACIFAGAVVFVGLLYKLGASRWWRREGNVPFIPAIFVGFFLTFLFFLV